MGKGHNPLTGDMARHFRRAASAGLLTGMIAIAGCATYPGLSGPTAQNTAFDAAAETPAAPADPERQAAVAEIRARAEAAAANKTGAPPNVFYSYGPDGTSKMTRLERLAVEAELDAVLAAQARAGNPAEAEQLKARAAWLRRLAQQHVAKAEADIQALSQAAK
jgi:hypothetical protein